MVPPQIWVWDGVGDGFFLDIQKQMELFSLVTFRGFSGICHPEKSGSLEPAQKQLSKTTRSEAKLHPHDLGGFARSFFGGV